MQSLRLSPLVLPRLDTLRELLALVGELRTIDDPLTSAAGLRRSLELVARLATLAGVDAAWTERVLAALDDARLFEIVLAISRYLVGLLEPRGLQPLDAATLESELTIATIDAQSFLDWLPLVLQLIEMLRTLRR